MSKPKHSNSLAAYTIRDISWAVFIGFVVGAIVASLIVAWAVS